MDRLDMVSNGVNLWKKRFLHEFSVLTSFPQGVSTQ